MKLFKCLISPLIAFLLAVFIPSSALAIDNNCIELKSFFDDCDDEIFVDEGDYCAVVKYIVDNEHSCFYISVSFVDSAMNSDDIFLRFRVDNSSGHFIFDINEDGSLTYISGSIEKNIDYSSSFSIRRKDKGGNMLVGFEIKDKPTRKLLNSISCRYYCGNSRSVLLLDGIELEPVDDKPAAASKSTTARTTKHKTTKARTTKTTRKPKSTTTKFVATKYITSQKVSVTTKFQATAQAETEATTSSMTQSDDEYWSLAMSNITTSTEAVKAEENTIVKKDSSLSVTLKILGSFTIIIGIIALNIGVVFKLKRKQSTKS